MSKKKIAIDCSRAIDDGVSERIIIERVQDFYNLKYFKDSSKWNADRYKILKISGNNSITGTRATAAFLYSTDGIKTIDWYDIEEDSNLVEILKKENKFNEELL